MILIDQALKDVDPETMGLPRSLGIARLDSSTETYEMIFQVPNPSDNYRKSYKIKPKTLRELLQWRHDHLDDVPTLSSTGRVQLPTRLARSLFYLHTTHIVHKNLRPGNIIIMNNDLFPSVIGQPYIVGRGTMRVAARARPICRHEVTMMLTGGFDFTGMRHAKALLQTAPSSVHCMIYTASA
jgi:serine/threonine protein kinase